MNIMIIRSIWLINVVTLMNVMIIRSIWLINILTLMNVMIIRSIWLISVFTVPLGRCCVNVCPKPALQSHACSNLM